MSEFLYYLPEHAGSGQYGICGKCKKGPTPEGHDGCLGTLASPYIMSACCGHGNDNLAYIQYWSRVIIRGKEAILEFEKLRSIKPKVSDENKKN